MKAGKCSSSRFLFLKVAVGIAFAVACFCAGVNVGVSLSAHGGGMDEAMSSSHEPPLGLGGFNASSMLKPLAGSSVHSSKLQFLFIVGLEGTGHHLIGNILRDSPMDRRLRRLQIHPKHTSALALKLFNVLEPHTSLFGVTCSGTVRPDLKPVKIKRDTINVNELFESVVDRLVQVRKIVEEQETSEEDDPAIVVPVNVWEKVDKPGRLGFEPAGQFSYPNYRGTCRLLQYPVLDLFYAACDKAQVDCRHVYLSREPYSFIHSTSIKRDYNPSALEAIHLYTSHLLLIQAHLENHVNRLWGCYDFFQPGLKATSEDWNLFQRVGGWVNDTNTFHQHMKENYRPPKRLNQMQRESLVPSNLRPYMDLLIQTRARVDALCQKQLEMQLQVSQG